MNLIARRTLLDFAKDHPETKVSLTEWMKRTKAAKWQSMADVVADFPKASMLNGERARFEIAGGNYRLIVSFKFSAQLAFVKFIGTHAAYDKVDALTVKQH
ncbi:MAG TPA: type II toxin-antitoxin system HigB family toxin [Stellaceae bacterium]|nr:type II toxin-antitoxin system HigB family toxin [Stellaceae bacterium]